MMGTGLFEIVGDVRREMTAAEVTTHADAMAAMQTVVSISDVSRRQLAQQLAVDDLISEDEAFAWAASGVIPTQLAIAIQSLPAAERFPARMALGGTMFTRAHPLTGLVGSIFGRTSAQLDEIWTKALLL